MCRLQLRQYYCSRCHRDYGQVQQIQPRICIEALENGGTLGHCSAGVLPAMKTTRGKGGACPDCRGKGKAARRPKPDDKKGGPGGPSSPGGGQSNSGGHGMFGGHSTSKDQGQGGGQSKEKPGPGEGKGGYGGSNGSGGVVNEKQSFAGHHVYRCKEDEDSKGRRSLWKRFMNKVRG